MEVKCVFVIGILLQALLLFTGQELLGRAKATRWPLKVESQSLFHSQCIAWLAFETLRGGISELKQRDLHIEDWVSFDDLIYVILL